LSSVRKIIKPVLAQATRRFGYELRQAQRRERFEDGFEQHYAQASAFSMTSRERMYACWQAATYVAGAKIEGDVVECGVWRGGSTMMLADALSDAGDTSRTLWLYDTFAGMSEPSEHDAKAGGPSAAAEWQARRRDDGVVDWCYASLEEVRANVALTKYPADRFRLVKGKVEDTIPASIPDQIAILRLDTDFYESTRHELQHLFPRLVRGGVVLVDDYGAWEGARRAVDEYLQALDVPLLLARTDFTGRMAIKTF